jgi:hypothetical protein
MVVKYGGYSHVHVLYELTSWHEHISHCDDDRVFPNRLDLLDRILSNLLDYGRTNLNYTSSSALILSQKAARTQLQFK